jgi:hypothetical protein
LRNKSRDRGLYERLGLIHLGKRRVQDLLDFIRDRDVSVVIDVGGNTAQFGAFLRAGGYRGRIVSFEPIGQAFETFPGVPWPMATACFVR